MGGEAEIRAKTVAILLKGVIMVYGSRDGQEVLLVIFKELLINGR